MVYKIKHMGLVLRSFTRNGLPVGHDHARGDVPLSEIHNELLSEAVINEPRVFSNPPEAKPDLK